MESAFLRKTPLERNAKRDSLATIGDRSICRFTITRKRAAAIPWLITCALDTLTRSQRFARTDE